MVDIMNWLSSSRLLLLEFMVQECWQYSWHICNRK